MSEVEQLGLAGLILFCSGIGLLAFVFFSTPPAASPRYGLRGLKRREALAAGGLVTAIDPILRFLAGVSARLPMAQTRANLDSTLVRAGDPMGFTPDEYVAMSVIVGVGMGGLGLFMSDLFGLPPAMAIFAGAMGATVPYFRMTGEIQRRARLVNRALPVAIDLAALCMGAGLDFPGALRQINQKALPKEEPLHEEFTRILQTLDLGRTRRDALLGFAERVPTEPVQEFVASVIQAEEKGNPLSTVLKTQAEVLRTKRSLAAEESASKAGVMMMIPLLLIFASIILILLGPFLLQGSATDF